MVFMSLISLNNVSLRYGPTVLLDCADLNVFEGDRLALIGRNGSGKTTLLKIIAAITQPDSGTVERSRGARLAYLPQDVPDKFEGTVYEGVASGLGESGKDLIRYRRMLARVGAEHSPKFHAEFDALTHRLDAADAWKIDVKVAEIIDRLELNADLDVNSVSAGLRRRVLLGRELAADPDILLLDEPTNHLDIDSVVWLEKFLKSYAKTAVFVSHDRTFLKNLATRVAEVDRGKLIAFDCDFDTFLKRRDDILFAEERTNAGFDKKLSKEEAWLKQGVRARRTRNEGRVKELMKLREVRQVRRERAGEVNLRVQEASSGGEKVMEAKDVSISFSGRKIIDKFSTTIFRGDKIGVIGRNGAGKTTLLNILLGSLKPDSGEVSYGTRLQISYFDQLRKDLNPNMRLFDFVGGGGDFVSVGGSNQNVMSYLQGFLFSPEQILSEIGTLSGGEKSRLMLAKMFATPANVLVLDEPTNDLDMSTIDILESALVSFPGTILLVSHDRSFLNNIVTGIFCFGGDGKVVEMVGGYDEYEAARAKNAAVRAEPAKTLKPAQTLQKRDKLSNKERAELENLPERIAELEAELAELSAKLEDSEFLVSHFSEIRQINARIAAIQKEDEELFERWSFLEERRAAQEKQ